MTEAQAALVREHDALVRVVAWPLVRCTRRHMEAADLLQAGYVGLCEAASRWRADRGVSFDTFARLRIRGAIVDTLRANRAVSGVARGDWTAATVTQLSQRDTEVARRVNVEAAIDAAALLAVVTDPRQRFALRARSAGWTFRAIGAAMQKCESRGFQHYEAGLGTIRRRIRRRTHHGPGG